MKRFKRRAETRSNRVGRFARMGSLKIEAGAPYSLQRTRFYPTI